MATRDAAPAPGGRILRLALAVLAAGVLADQASKAWAFSRGGGPHVLVPGYLVAFPVPNAGIILGLGRDRAATAAAFALAAMALGARLAWIAYADRRRWRGADWPAGALLGAGMLGNSLDRLALGHVRDFLVTRAAPNLAFNVADLLVAAGLAGLLLALFRGERAGRAAIASP